MLTVYSIGHSNHPFEKFLALLRKHDIDTLVDVRSRPASRFCPQFNKKHLESALPENDVNYVFMGRALGGRPENPEFFDEEGYVLYYKMAETETLKNAIAELKELLEFRRVAVMCGEEDPEGCHRRLLVGRCLGNVEMMHIRKDGSVEPETIEETGQLSLFGKEDRWVSVKPSSRKFAAKDKR